MDSVTILFDDGVSDEFRARIQSALEAVLPDASSGINASDIEIVIGADVAQTIPETGVGGSTENPNKILVWIDPAHSNVQKHIENEVQSTVVHELHHAMRNRLYPWPGTLLDDVVGEGLADHFDIEINGQRPKPWSQALSDEELTAYRAKAEPHFFEQNTEDDYYKWVLGSDEDGIPQWAGYALGFQLVGDYLSKTGKKASELVQLESSEFLK
ncbi:MAG: DUF2268 domain-containing putative Zn-dependent protease [Candidatus Paceibacterota bacterium]